MNAKEWDMSVGVMCSVNEEPSVVMISRKIVNNEHSLDRKDALAISLGDKFTPSEVSPNIYQTSFHIHIYRHRSYIDFASVYFA